MVNAEPVTVRCCAVCGAAMLGRRSHARYCSGACRAEASRVRRLLDGQEADGCVSLADYRVRRRNRTGPVDDAPAAA